MKASAVTSQILERPAYLPPVLPWRRSKVDYGVSRVSGRVVRRLNFIGPRRETVAGSLVNGQTPRSNS